MLISPTVTSAGTTMIRKVSDGPSPCAVRWLGVGDTEGVCFGERRLA